MIFIPMHVLYLLFQEILMQFKKKTSIPLYCPLIVPKIYVENKVLVKIELISFSFFFPEKIELKDYFSVLQ